MRKVCLLMLIIMTLLLTSCSSGDSNMVRDLFKKNERETANERFEALIGAIQNQDRVALKAFFSEKSLKESQNIEETITALFDYFRGDMLSYNDWGSLGSIGGMNEDGTGRYWRCCMRLTMLKRPRISTALPWNICCWIPQMQIMWVYGLCTLSD